MDVLKINTDQIHILKDDIKYNYSKVTKVYNEIHSMRSQIDWEIRSQDGINSRLNHVIHSLEDVNTKIKELEDFIKYAVKRYSDTEKSIKKQANDVAKNRPADLLKVIRTIWDQLKVYSDDEQDNIFDVFDINQIYTSALGLSGALNKKLLDSLDYRMFVKNGKTYVQIITGETDYFKLKKLFTDNIGAELAGKKGKLYQKLINEGIPVYNDNLRDGGFKTNRRYLSNADIGDLDQYIKRLDYSSFRKMVSGGGHEFVEGLKFWDDFTNWGDASKYAKVGKTAGIFGNLLMVGNNLNTALNAETGTVDTTRRFIVDTTVDLGTGAAAMGAGGAVGSLILPPLGTVVGAGVGIGINFAINYEFGKPPKSIVDHTKDVVNKGADIVVDAVSDTVGAAKSAINDATDKVTDMVDGVGKKLGKIFW